MGINGLKSDINAVLESHQFYRNLSLQNIWVLRIIDTKMTERRFCNFLHIVKNIDGQDFEGSQFGLQRLLSGQCQLFWTRHCKPHHLQPSHTGMRCDSHGARDWPSGFKSDDRLHPGNYWEDTCRVYRYPGTPPRVEGAQYKQGCVQRDAPRTDSGYRWYLVNYYWVCSPDSF